MTAAVQPFPWHTLLPARQPVASARALERIAGHPVTRALMERLGAITGTAVDVRLRSVLTGSKSPSDRCAMAVTLLDDAGTPCIHVEVEGLLGALLVARVFKRPLHSLRLDPFADAPPEICGAFAAVAISALRKCHPEALPFVVGHAGPARSIMTEAALSKATLATFNVMVDDEAYLARVAFTREAAIPFAGEDLAPWNSASLERLGDMPLAMRIVASASLMSADDVAQLIPGNAWLPDGFPLHRAGGGLVGPVVLSADGAERGVRATLGEDGRIVIGGSVEDLSMSQDERALIENVGDVPVVVRIEIGATEMRAREWAKLRPGDVITTGQPLGAPVTLRVGGVEIAQGELVDVEGEIGVRILEPTGRSAPIAPEALRSLTRTETP